MYTNVYHCEPYMCMRRTRRARSAFLCEGGNQSTLSNGQAESPGRERGQPGGIRTRRCWSGTLHIDIFSHQNQEEESIASVKTDYIMGLTNLTVDWQSVCSAVWNMLATNTMEHSGKEHRGTHSETVVHTSAPSSSSTAVARQRRRGLRTTVSAGELRR